MRESFVAEDREDAWSRRQRELGKGEAVIEEGCTVITGPEGEIIWLEWDIEREIE